MKNKISFIVFTHNEENRVEMMLRCLYGHGEIILVDNFSNDKTIFIAKKYTKKIYRNKNIGWVENEKTIKFAEKIASNNWIYLAYVDEIIPNKLLNKLKDIVIKNNYDAVEIYRKNFMFGREVFNYGKHHLRMFKKDSVDFKNNIVHKFGRYRENIKVLKIKNEKYLSLWHFSEYNCNNLELTHNRYANIEANQRHLILRQKFSGFRAIFKLFFFFFGTYIAMGGFKGGWPGFFISVKIAYYKFSIEARLWEIENNITIDSMIKKYNKIKLDLIGEKHYKK